MNCLLMRELSLDLILRVWDTYLAEHGGSDDDADATNDGLAVLHVRPPHPSLFHRFFSPRARRCFSRRLRHT